MIDDNGPAPAESRVTYLCRRALTGLGVLSASPLAFLTVTAYVSIWIMFDSAGFDWHAAATVATWFMTLRALSDQVDPYPSWMR